MPDWKKFIAGKVVLAKKGNQPGKTNTNSRVPAGQNQVKNFPVLDIGIKPTVTKEEWSLHVYGLVENELLLDWAAFLALPQITDVSDFHCVTRWSQLDMEWQGVRAQHVLALVAPLSTAKFVTLHGYDGYTTNIALEALLDDDVIIAHSVLGAPLTREHGGPVRMVVPKRYAWKSAKWLKAIELHAEDKPGFWEVRGYHNYADPWREERFSND
ncbi:sulfite oxidase-like oxidoreductase [Methylotenera sp.]|jgi:DMSO/TMAO reductase YedYZ molybdopterin-dependent catalytic subunit|uniref:sulfite oxidase-like oxidoreductase n=1 Tax=Methylotenera sp. TaxID=2051956 RepID=UPI002731F4C0|nr:sulfite oxidase-like oxidoreductase [Methylotenera sp.]MDP2230060.1 sulfite oxidase-like oxidoreductase [Methylotenera sp.]MDP3142128.1 sulfite oxidase-like oxidoreductase [Methylotenera sp.]